VLVAELAGTLAGRGVDVTVYTRRDGPAQPIRVRLGPRLEVVHIEAGPREPVPKDELLPHIGAFARRLREHWRLRPPDVVHAHFWMSGLAALDAARGLGLPVVQTFHALGAVKRRHQGDRDTSPIGREAAERRIASAVDHVLATSDEELFELARMGASPSCVSVVPGGVDPGVFRPDGRALPRSSGRPRVAVVTRLVERKGIGDLVAALVAVPDCELIVAGGPEREHLDRDPEHRRLRGLAQAAGVAGRVTFLGRLTRVGVAELIRSADVVACVPWYEPFGMTAVEAMACGVPVLATAAGGLVDTVVDGVTGVHVPPRQPGAIARALVELLALPRVRASMGEAGTERARARYRWDVIAGRTLGVYRRIGDERRTPPLAREV
jgi:glycosyltransferase involved in cell wall biosynthesis